MHNILGLYGKEMEKKKNLSIKNANPVILELAKQFGAKGEVE